LPSCSRSCSPRPRISCFAEDSRGKTRTRSRSAVVRSSAATVPRRFSANCPMVANRRIEGPPGLASGRVCAVSWTHVENVPSRSLHSALAMQRSVGQLRGSSGPS
jgi:hypothetical protein